MVVFVVAPRFEPVPGIEAPMAAWLPVTPCPLATAPACEALLGTPGKAPPASARLTLQAAISGL